MAETGLSKISNVFTPMVEHQMETAQIKMSDYQKMCVTGAIQQIYQLSVEKGIDLNKSSSDVNNILMTVASLELNANAEPRQVYFQPRSKNVGTYNNPQWIKTVEMGIEGDGNDALLERFGRNVAYIHPFWLVREGDKFEYPKHRGIEMTPPVWDEVGDPEKKVVKVVYPIDMYTSKKDKDGDFKTSTEYFITDREQVKRNLLAHMANNLMKDKEGKATKLTKIHEFADSHTLDQILDDKDMQVLGKISPAWREPQSRETMIVRKMRNNIVKKIPKDFSNGMAQIKYEEATNDSLQQARRDVTANANQVEFADAVLEDNDNANSQQNESTTVPEMPQADPVENNDETKPKPAPKETGETVPTAPDDTKGGEDEPF